MDRREPDASAYRLMIQSSSNRTPDPAMVRDIGGQILQPRISQMTQIMAGMRKPASQCQSKLNQQAVALTG